jgi:hypothetical protein
VHGDRKGPRHPTWWREPGDYIGASQWTFARTRAENPHRNIVRHPARAAGLGEGHEALGELIRWFYHLRFWHGHGHRSIDVGGFSH